MKKIKKFLRIDFGLTKLFFDDLEEIINILKEASEKIDINTEDFQIESMEEFGELDKEDLNILRVETFNPWIVLDIQPRESYIYAGEDTLITRGVLDKIKSIFRRRRYKFSWLASEFISKISSPLIILLLFDYLILDKKAIFMILVIIFSSLSIVNTIFIFSLKNRITLAKKSDKKSFWRRKKDDIILAIISALIGSVIGAIVTLIITKIL